MGIMTAFPVKISQIGVHGNAVNKPLHGGGIVFEAEVHQGIGIGFVVFVKELEDSHLPGIHIAVPDKVVLQRPGVGNMILPEGTGHKGQSLEFLRSRGGIELRGGKRRSPKLVEGIYKLEIEVGIKGHLSVFSRKVFKLPQVILSKLLL